MYGVDVDIVQDEDRTVMYDIKTVLDPYDIVNPGKMFEGMTRYGMPMPGAMMSLGMGMMAVGKKVLPKDKGFTKAVKDHDPERGHHGGNEEKAPAPKEKA